MNIKESFEFLSKYNMWANDKLFSTCAQLQAVDLSKDRGAYFGSILNTLNHILVADRLWLSRFNHESTGDVDLGALLYSDFRSLWEARKSEDEKILAFIMTKEESDLANGVFSYMDTRGFSLEAEYHKALIHFFNHQTHHRGQVHAMLSQGGYEAPALDIIYFYQEAPKSL